MTYVSLNPQLLQQRGEHTMKYLAATGNGTIALCWKSAVWHKCTGAQGRTRLMWSLVVQDWSFHLVSWLQGQLLQRRHLNSYGCVACRNGAVETYTLSRRLTFASLMAKPCGTIAPSVSGSGSSHSGLASSSSGPAASLRILGLSVSVTDDHLAVATANGKLLLLGLTAALQAQQDIDDEAQMTTNFGVGSCTGDAVLQLASGSAVASPRFLSGAGHSCGTSDDILALTESEQDEAVSD